MVKMGEENWWKIEYGVQIGYIWCVGTTNSLKLIQAKKQKVNSTLVEMMIFAQICFEI